MSTGPVLLFAVIGACGFLEVLAIVQIALLRKQLGSQPHLSRQPPVKKWMRYCRLAVVVAIAASIWAAQQLHDPRIFAISIGAAVVLLIIADTIGSNSHEHGDGDSGE